MTAEPTSEPARHRTTEAAAEAKNCACPCGETQFSAHAKPVMRGYCHCTICQAFNQAAYADITLFRARDVTLPPDGAVDYKAHKSGPAVQRGTCAACGKPAVEYMDLPGLPKLVIVPTANVLDPALVPSPKLHVFYHRRVADVDDGLPKYSGFLSSQLAFGARVVRGLIAAPKP